MKKLTEIYLDCKLTYMAQDLDAVDEVISQASWLSILQLIEITYWMQACARYPVLDNYRSMWPLHNFIRMALKYSRSQDKKAVDKARAANAKRNLQSKSARSRCGASTL